MQSCTVTKPRTERDWEDFRCVGPAILKRRYRCNAVRFSRLNGSMFPISSLHCCRALSIALVFSAVTFPHPASAQGTHLWAQSQFEEFEKGTPQGVAITNDGHLREGPGLTELLTTPSTFVWSVATGKNGAVFAGTGSPASVLRLAAQKDDKPVTLFESKDLSVQVLRLGLDGSLYVATLPSGRVYKLNPDAQSKQNESSATVVFDASKLDASDSDKAAADKQVNKTHYIWDLSFDSAGLLYIATGDPGAVYRIDPSKPAATPELFFKSDEAHIRALAWDAKGNLIAGSDGTGLVYRIDKQGKGYVLYEAPRREITSLAIAANGTIYAASVGDKSHNPLPQLPVQGAGNMSISVIQPQSLTAANSSTAIPEGSEIDAIADGKAPRKVWSGKDEVVYALAARTDGLIALTGNRGRILRIQDDGTFADIAHLDAQHGLSFAAQGSDLIIGTGNTGKVILLGAAKTHEYASDVFDAGRTARFGRIEIEPGSSAYQILTRSGNIEQPVRGWTDWQPLNNGVIASPSGRFLQWKAVLETGGVVGSVGVNYLPVNTAPVVDEMVVVPGARLNSQNSLSNQQNVNIALPSSGQSASLDTSSSGPIQGVKDKAAITVRWAAHDDDGDDLIYALYLRGDGETVWRLLKDKVTEKAYSFDAVQVPDGGYQIKVVASDAPSHTTGSALTGDKVSERFVVDTTPPAVTELKALHMIACGDAPCTSGLVVTFDAQDATSPIAHAEYSLDAGTWQYVEPTGGISDSKAELYSFQIPGADWKAEHVITVRAYDRYENVGVAKTVIPAQAP